MKLAIALGAVGFAIAAVPASAQTTVSFPGVGTEWLSQTNGGGVLAGGDQTFYMWTAGDYVRDSFADTGVTAATSLSGTGSIENILGSVDLFVDVLLNGTTVGQFTIAACNFCTEIQQYSFDFSFGAIAGDDFDVEYRLANTIPGGEGSIAWLEGGRLTIDGAVVPEPASWALMIAGFGLVGSAMRRRVRAVAA